jgi:SAM-dependent methyltransferase
VTSAFTPSRIEEISIDLTRGPAAGLPPLLAYGEMSRPWETEQERIRVSRPSPYDPIADLYDSWSRSVVEDVAFYLEEARTAGGRVVELGVGTGRIALPIARAGIPVLGVDSSERMLEVCRRRAARMGVEDRLDLRLGDLRDPPVDATTSLVLCPFRSYLHLPTDADRRAALEAARRLLEPGGRLVFDVFAPAPDDIAETNGRWLEREPEIYERADWDANARNFTLRVRGPAAETAMELAWTSPEEWRRLLEETGFEVLACYGWFDRRPYDGGEDTIWMSRRPPA